MKLAIGDFWIRDLEVEDGRSITRHADNPRVAQMLRDLFPRPYSLTDALEFILMTNRTEPRAAFAIASDEEAFGVIGFNPGRDVYRFSAEIGYWIGEDYWGQGIMTRAVKAFSDHLFETHDFQRLFAGTFSSNPASGRVLEKAGFVREGIFRSHVTKNGTLLDEHLYARVRPGSSAS